MKSTLKLALAVSLALGSTSALALQLGQIRVKSALDEPLVAEIPVQLDNLAEAQGLSVNLASDADFARAGLSRPYGVDLRFNIVTDSTGHKIVLVTSNQPVGDPYLDFLLQVNTRKGRQLREYTVLLDPVIASTPPMEEEASTPAPAQETAAAPIAQAPTMPAPAQQTPAPQPQAAQPPRSIPQPAYTPPPAATPSSPARSGEYTVGHGDTLYKIAKQTRPDSQVSVDQMMLALKQTNPGAFYRDNINSLRSGAILRIPTHEAIDATSAAEARAQVHRQYEDWRGAAARKATVVGENTAAPTMSPAAVAKSANTSDRLALVPPAQGGGSAASRPGQSGGTSNDTVAGLRQQFTTTKEALTSAKQENTDLQSRVKDLEEISGKNQKLLGMKDAQIAELQRKLAQAQQQAGKPAMVTSATAPAASATTAAPKPAASIAPASSIASAATSTTPAAAGTSVSPVASMATPVPVAKTAAQTAPVKQPPPRTGAQPAEALPWYRQPLTWVIGAIVILALILLGLLRRRPQPLPEPLDEEPPLADQFGASPLARVSDDAAIEDTLHAQIADHPGDLDAHLALCLFYNERGDVAQFEAAAERMHEHVIDPPQPQWLEVLTMGEQSSPAHPLFAVAPVAGMAAAAELADQQILHAGEEAQPAGDHKYRFAFDEPPAEPLAAGMAAAESPVAGHDIHDDVTRQHAVPGFADEDATPVVADADADWSASVPDSDDAMPFSDDPVDTKLDLARAYLDMGDPAGARAMLEEVSNEGTQMQKDEAKRLLEGIR